MTRADLNRIALAVARYTGRDVSEHSVQAVEDPKVAGTVAIRVTFSQDARLIAGASHPGSTEPVMDFLLRNVWRPDLDAVTIERELEEVKFAAWPPTSGSPRILL